MLEGQSKKQIRLKWRYLFYLIIVLGLINVAVNRQSLKASYDSIGERGSMSAASAESESSIWNYDGTYKVGTDIPAGEYLVCANSVSCYFEVASDSSGTLDSIITNDNTSSEDYVSVTNGQYLEVSGGMFTLSDNIAAAQPVNGFLQDGEYKVGKDINAGEYEIYALESSCYFQVSKDCAGTLDSIVTNDIISGGSSTYVTVKDGQFLTVSGGEIYVGQ